MTPRLADAPLTVAIQGQPGSWSALALEARFGAAAVAVPCTDFRDALAALRAGRAQLALVPVANTTIGRVEPAATLVEAPDLKPLAELSHPIRHCLATPRPVEIGAVTHVHSQAPALAQCAARLAALGVVCVEEADTAAAADVVRALGQPGHAVLCSPRAADDRGLAIIARDLSDRSHNVTTWTLLARR